MPERIEDYEVLGVIGTGSFGTCYKVRKKNTPHVFVWKAVDYGSMTEERKKLLVSEVNVLRELRHPNIVRYYDRILHKESTTIYIIMEWCEGGDLATLINKCKRTHTYVDEAFVWKTLYQTSRALQACHGPGRPVLHRDIKPANLFLDAQFNIKLGDFGLARVLSSVDLRRDDIDSCYAETIVGTPYYMSPEVVKGSKYNRKSDVWSLGCVIYELCSLHPPFSCQNVNVLAQRIKNGKFSRIPSHYSEELHNVIVFMLTVEHDVRPSVDTILHHPSVVTHIPSWSKLDGCSLRIPDAMIKPKKKSRDMLDETFCSCENDCCSTGAPPIYAEIGNPTTKPNKEVTSQSDLQGHPITPVDASGFLFPPVQKTDHCVNRSKVVMRPKENLTKSAKHGQELHAGINREQMIVAERLEMLRQREVKLRMKEMTLDERERAVQRKEREAALASRLARETMGRACVYLKTCKGGRSGSMSTVTKVTLRSRSPSENAPSLPDADSSLDQEHGETSTIAKTSIKLDPKNVCKPSWSMSRKVTFNMKDTPQLIDGFTQDPSVVDNVRNAGLLTAGNSCNANGNARPSSWSDNYYWLESKKQAFRQKNLGKENNPPDVLALNKKVSKKNVLLPQSNNFLASGMVHSQPL